MVPTTDNVEPDHAVVAFRPPIMLGILLVIGFVLRAIVPLRFLSGRLNLWVGPIVVVLAFALFFWAVRTMHQGGSTLPTREPTEAIVRSGPYRFSRNPIYFAMVAMLIGVGLWANSLWFITLAAVDAGLLYWGVISREEAYLERKFGVSYVAYKSQVRRWL